MTNEISLILKPSLIIIFY